MGRRPKGWSRWLIPSDCIVHRLEPVYQLSIASWLIIDSTFIRSIHLGLCPADRLP